MIFTTVVLGGIGSAYGALAGGIALGLVMELSTWSGFAGGLDAKYKPVLAFLALILVFFGGTLLILAVRRLKQFRLKERYSLLFLLLGLLGLLSLLLFLLGRVWSAACHLSNGSCK